MNRIGIRLLDSLDVSSFPRVDEAVNGICYLGNLVEIIEVAGVLDPFDLNVGALRGHIRKDRFRLGWSVGDLDKEFISCGYQIVQAGKFAKSFGVSV